MLSYPSTIENLGLQMSEAWITFKTYGVLARISFPCALKKLHFHSFSSRKLSKLYFLQWCNAYEESRVWNVKTLFKKSIRLLFTRTLWIFTISHYLFQGPIQVSVKFVYSTGDYFCGVTKASFPSLLLGYYSWFLLASFTTIQMEYGGSLFSPLFQLHQPPLPI